MPVNSQVNAKKESVWNTPITTDRTFEFEQESIVGGYARTESAPIRTGQYGLRQDRSQLWYSGAAGSLEMVPLTKGFAFWLEFMLGATVATTGPTDSAFTHTFAAGTALSMMGRSFTLQVDRPFYPALTSQAFTYAGGKVNSWEIAQNVEDHVKCTLDLDFASESTATALAAATYPSGTVNVFPWVKTVVSIGGSNVGVQSFSVKCNNQLKSDIRHLAGSTVKDEQVPAGLREITFECVPNFADLTQYNRYAALVESTATVAVVITLTGPTLIGVSAFPTLVLTLPAVRLDGTNPTVSDLNPLMQTISGKAVVHPSSGHLTAAYTTLDATP